MGSISGLVAETLIKTARLLGCRGDADHLKNLPVAHQHANMHACLSKRLLFQTFAAVASGNQAR